jgi:hypothetical protein
LIGTIASYPYTNGRTAMTQLNPIQEAILPHIRKAKYEAVCDEAEDLMVENELLKERVQYLEIQIATHVFGGWKTH